MNNNSGTPQYVLAIASATATADAIGIIIHVTDGNNFTMATSGRITVDYCVPNEVAGTVLFLSHATAGVLTSTEPSAAGHVSKPMAVITIANSEMIMLQQRGEVISTGAVSIADGSIDNDAMADDAINTAEIVNDAVTADKLANSINTEIAANTAKVTNATHTGDVTGATALTIATDAVDIAMLSATGTASSSTFLRGDNAWAAATSTFIGVRVENSANQSINNNSSVPIVFDASVTQFDTDTMHVSGSSSRITFTTAGKYFVAISYAWAGNSSGRRNVSCRKNGSPIIHRQTIHPSTADESHNGYSLIYEFSATDYVEFIAHQTSGGALNIMADGEGATTAMAYKID
jgi:hypothetical protein